MMTRRDYFAAHAPIEIPTWFEHPEPPKNIPPKPDFAALDPAHQSIVRDWQEDPCFDLPEELTWYAEKWTAYQKARADWNDENDAARFFHWRWYYADRMLVAGAT